MGKRRGAKEGSIFQRKDGRWCAQITVGKLPSGRVKYKTVYGATRSVVSETLKKLLVDQQNGHDIAPGRQTLGQFMAVWLEDTIRLQKKYTTWRSYEWLTRKHITPSIGHYALKDINRTILQKLVRDKHAEGLSATTLKHMNATLKSALKHAVNDRVLAANPAKLVSLPRAERFEPTVLTPAHAATLLKHLAGHPREGLYVTALLMGLRRGELLALKWSSVDLELATLDVRKSIHRVKGAGLQLGEPKSKSSNRKLRIPQICIAALARWRVLQAQQKQWAGSKWSESDFVFTSTIGTPLHPDDVSREFPLILRAAGLPKARLHDARHCCATLLMSMGVHAKMVQATLGHSSYQITMDLYSHALPQLQTEVADRLDELFTVKPTVNEEKLPIN